MVSRLVGARLVLSEQKIKTTIEKCYCWLTTIGNALRSPLLLVIRLYWGWEFFLTGKGKLMDLSKPAQYFESLGIPLPHFSALFAGCTELIGGLLLLVGLASRLISIPLMILLVTAYFTADSDAVRAIFSDPDKFLSAAEFQFLFAVVIIFVFGPGKFSIDWLIKRKVASPSSGSVVQLKKFRAAALLIALSAKAIS